VDDKGNRPEGFEGVRGESCGWSEAGCRDLEQNHPLVSPFGNSEGISRWVCSTTKNDKREGNTPAFNRLLTRGWWDVKESETIPSISTGDKVPISEILSLPVQLLVGRQSSGTPHHLHPVGPLVCIPFTSSATFSQVTEIRGIVDQTDGEELAPVLKER